MKNLQIKAKVLEYSKALPAEKITLKMFISLIFNIQSVHQWPLVDLGEGGRAGDGWEGGSLWGSWPLCGSVSSGW